MENTEEIKKIINEIFGEISLVERDEGLIYVENEALRILKKWPQTESGLGKHTLAHPLKPMPKHKRAHPPVPDVGDSPRPLH